MKSVKKLKKDIEIRTRWKRIRSYAVELCYACPVHIYLEVLDILRHLRFCDYSDLDESDSLRKIRPFLNFVQTKCKTTYLPKKEICVDESLLLLKGRIRFRRYIPTKRARYGILSYCLCESGYIWNVQISQATRARSKDACAASLKKQSTSHSVRRLSSFFWMTL